MLSEERLLGRIASRWKPQPAVPVGPGDDMAVISLGGDRILVAADPVIEGVHFTPDVAPRRIAAKAIRRNVSDAAAMAAKPRAVICCVLLGRDWQQHHAEALLDGLEAEADLWKCPNVGGDIAIHDGPTTITVTLIAEPDGIEPVLRSTARPGDTLYVTGQLGGALEEHGGRIHHLDFVPRLEAARTLASQATTRPSAMIDLSDGLARDLPRLLNASGGLQAEVRLDQLPIRDTLSGDHLWRRALGDGEDYELLLAHPGELPREVMGVSLTPIGRLINSGSVAGVRYIWEDGTSPSEEELTDLGWEHRG